MGFIHDFFIKQNRVSGWPRGRNFGGVTGELRRLGLKRNSTLSCLKSRIQSVPRGRDAKSVLYLSATLKERLRARGAPIGYGHFPKN
jgi:hypothetical protein